MRQRIKRSKATTKTRRREEEPMSFVFESSRLRGCISSLQNLARQNSAIGLIGEPVPPRNGSGAAISRNSQRRRGRLRPAPRGRRCPRRARRARRARSRGTPAGDSSRAAAASHPAKPRLQGWRHPLPQPRDDRCVGPRRRSPRLHGPTASRPAHRPVRMNSASPGETFTPALLLPRLDILDVNPRAWLQIRRRLSASGCRSGRPA